MPCRGNFAQSDDGSLFFVHDGWRGYCTIWDFHAAWKAGDRAPTIRCQCERVDGRACTWSI